MSRMSGSKIREGLGKSLKEMRIMEVVFFLVCDGWEYAPGYYNAFSAVFKSFFKEIQINPTAVASGLMGNITCFTCR
jgi:hypothetical protein